MRRRDRKDCDRLLDEVGIGGGREALFASGEGVALVANLVNWAAKTIHPSWYQVKERLVVEALEQSQDGWVEGNIVYIETPSGQVSFHMKSEVKPTGLPAGRWDGCNSQLVAAEMICRYLEIEPPAGWRQRRYNTLPKRDGDHPRLLACEDLFDAAW